MEAPAAVVYFISIFTDKNGMTLSVRLDSTHSKSWQSQFRMGFRLILVPESRSTVRNFHYVVLLDTSSSMLDENKYETAMEGLKGMLSRIPKDNFVTLITFSDTVKVIAEHSPPDKVMESLNSIQTAGRTSLYAALAKAVEVIEKWEDKTAKVILITDGYPTDVTDENAYSRISLPQGIGMVAVGVGTEYNDKVLNTIVNATNGLFHHLEDPNKLPDVLSGSVGLNIAGSNVDIHLMSPLNVTLINYSGNPIRIGAIEGVIRVYGWIDVTPMFEGQALSATVTYLDTVTGRSEEITKTIKLGKANSQQEWVGSVNKEILAEVNYQDTLKSLPNVLEDSVAATKALNRLQTLAEQTKKLDLIESTRKLTTEVEQTKKLGDIDSTRKLVSSEVTRKLRGDNTNTSS